MKIGETLLESEISQFLPLGDNVAIIKDEDEGTSGGGIVIPDAHREYKRRGWVLAMGGGYRLEDGTYERLPYRVGDYLVCDRAFNRPDEREDELFSSPCILLIRGDEPLFFIRMRDCVGKTKLPEKFLPLIKKLNPDFGKEQNDARGNQQQ